MLVAVSSVLLGVALATAVLFAQDVLGLPGRGFGGLLAAFGAGGLVGAGLAAPLRRRVGTAGALLGGLTVAGLGLGAGGLVSSGLAAAAFLVIAGCGAFVFTVVATSTRQALVPDPLLGRVTSLFLLLAWAGTAPGGLLGGLVARWLGLRAPFVVAAATLMLAVGIVGPRLGRGLATPPAGASSAARAEPERH